MFHKFISYFKFINQEPKVRELFVYRILFTFLPLTVGISSKFLFSISDFSEFQVFLIYLTSFGGLFSIGFFATFQYLSARDLLSIRIFQYLAIYLGFLIFTYFICLFYDILALSDWRIGIIIIFYLGSESLLNVYTGQRSYKFYYFYPVLRYLFFLTIVLSGVFSGKYNIILVFELILFLTLFINFYWKYKNFTKSDHTLSVLYSNVLPNFSSSIGVKNILLYATFILTNTEAANIKFMYTLFGMVNFVPQVVLSDFINKLIKTQLLSLSKTKIVFIGSTFFLVSLLFSVALFYFNTVFNFLGNLDIIMILLFSVVNFLIQLVIFINQVFFALGMQRLRLLSDLVFSILMFTFLALISIINSVVFLIISAICMLLIVMFNYFRLKNNQSLYN